MPQGVTEQSHNVALRFWLCLRQCKEGLDFRWGPLNLTFALSLCTISHDYMLLLLGTWPADVGPVKSPGSHFRSRSLSQTLSLSVHDLSRLCALVIGTWTADVGRANCVSC